MTRRPRLALFGLALAAGLFATPAFAASQSSNTSSNCSNGRCTRVDTYTVEDRRGTRSWRRVERWNERAERRDERRGRRVRSRR